MVFFIFVLIILMCCSVIARLIVFHPFATVYYGVKDFVNYFRHKKYNWLEAGKLDSYNAHFGGGKTLSMVHYVVFVLFKKYNNKKVWDRGRKKFVTQKLHIVSNVTLNNVPFEPLESLAQIVNIAEHSKEIDIESDTRTVVQVIIDEASAQLNSRNFKTNIDFDFLNTLITCRHYNISIMYSSQKFKLTDALLRAVTQKCIVCKKIWRFVIQSEYDADEIEYASDPTMVRPLKRTGFFVLDKDYAAYDTLAVVDKLKKSVDNNDMMSAAEILQLRGNLNPDNDAVSHRSGKLKRRKK